MGTEGLIVVVIPLVYLTMIVVEAWRPGVARPHDLRWQALCAIHFLLLAVVNNLAGAAARRWLPADPLFDGSRLGLTGGVIIGYLSVSLGNALLHLAYHHSDLLWRWVHRYHHQPRRLDVAGVMYQTPLEMAANAVLFAMITVWGLGLDARTTLACACVASFYGMFQHLNTPTPRWLGWLIQRPEAHSLHHRRGCHHWNYSDLPLWDALLRTFRNPQHFHADVGIDDRNSELQAPRWQDDACGP